MAPTPSGLAHSDAQAQTHTESSATSLSRVCHRPQQPSAPTCICELLRRYDVATPTDQSARSVASPRPIKTRTGARCSDPGHVSMRSEQANDANVAAFLSAEGKSRSHSSNTGFGRRKNTNNRDGQAKTCHEYESDDDLVARFPRTIKVGRNLTVRLTSGPPGTLVSQGSGSHPVGTSQVPHGGTTIRLVLPECPMEAR